MYSMPGVDYVALFYWFITFVALAILVASLYRSMNTQPSTPMYMPAPIIPEGQNYFISVASGEIDARIGYAVDSLKYGEYSEAVKYSWQSVEMLLISACIKLGLDTSHSNLQELASRLSNFGLLGLDTAKVKYLDDALKAEQTTGNEAIAKRCVSAAVQLRDYFKQAPVRLNAKRGAVQ